MIDLFQGFGIAFPNDAQQLNAYNQLAVSMIEAQRQAVNSPSLYQLLGLMNRRPDVPDGWADWYENGDQLH